MKIRRIALYFAWSRPAEIDVDLGLLENRYPTLFEFRRALWPHLKGALKDPAKYPQDIRGFLDHVILSDFECFRKVAKEMTGHEVELIQREGDRPPAMELDRDFLDRFETLIVVSLDHFRTRQRAAPSEIEAIRDFLRREDRCVFICPHHDLGAINEGSAQVVEYTHHGDPLVPAQQRIGGFARSLFNGLDLPVENRWGLNPAAVDGRPAPLVIENAALDSVDTALLAGVATFNLHPHLPHLSFDPACADRVEVLARQRINPNATPHPFVDAGNRTFNALLRLKTDQLGGRVYVNDATLWSSAFGGVESLTRFWRNLAGMPL